MSVSHAANQWFAGLRKALPQFFWISRGVKDTANHHRVIVMLIEYRVWKPPNQSATVILMYHGVHTGRSAQCLNAGSNASQELLAQACASPLISRVSLREIPAPLPAR